MGIEGMNKTDRTLVAVQNAALERALVGSSSTAQYVAFAGALEVARDERADQDETSIDGKSEANENDPWNESETTTHVGVTSLLACLVASRVFESGTDARRVPSPTAFDATDRQPLLEGALLAYERFELSIERAATLAERRPMDLKTELRRRERSR